MERRLVGTQANNSAMSIWPDVSGNNAHLRQTVAASQPTFFASDAAIGGHAAVEFDGAGDFFSTPAQMDTKTVVLVYKYFSSGRRDFLGSTSGVYYNQLGANELFRSDTGTAYGFQPYNQLYINSMPVKPALAVKQMVYTVLIIDVTDALGLNRIISVGKNFAEQSVLMAFHGRMTELIMYDYRMTTLNRKALESSLMTKYGI